MNEDAAAMAGKLLVLLTERVPFGRVLLELTSSMDIGNAKFCYTWCGKIDGRAYEAVHLVMPQELELSRYPVDVLADSVWSRWRNDLHVTAGRECGEG